MSSKELGEQVVNLKFGTLLAAFLSLVASIAVIAWYGAAYAHKIDAIEPRVMILEEQISDAQTTIADVKYIKESITEIKENLKYLMRK